jgi:hypothetical protein
MAGLLMALVGAGAAFTAIVYVPHAAIRKSNFD